MKRIFELTQKLWQFTGLILITMTFTMCSHLAFAQSTASIGGTVSDLSGAVVPRAKILLRNTDTNVVRTTLADGTGHYSVPSITPGNYSISVSEKSFSTAELTGVTLSVNQVATYNFSLKPGSTEETVEVQSEASTVQAASSALGTVIDTKSVVDLPLNGRNFTQLLELTPGVGRVTVAQNGEAQKPIGSFTFPSVNGQDNRNNLYYLDGINNSGGYQGTYNYGPIIDDIQEFKVLTHTDLAEFGQTTGGIVNVVTKSGTNQYHGRLWEYIRNSAFDATPYFSKKVNPLRQNQFGGTLGGPVMIPHFYDGHNRTFFEFAYEGFRQSQAAQTLLTTPTEAQLNGDFSALLAKGIIIYDPASTTPDPANPGKYLRTAFPGNIIPVDSLNAASLAYAKGLFPKPNATGLAGGQNLIDNSPVRTNLDSYTGRMDQALGTRDNLYGRVSYSDTPFTTPAQNPNELMSSNAHGWNIALHEVHTFGPNSVGIISFGRNVGGAQNRLTFPGAPANFASALISSGFSSSFVSGFPGPVSTVIPVIQIPGYLGSTNKNYTSTSNADSWEFGGSFIHTIGRHTIKAGASFSTNNHHRTTAMALETTAISQTGNLEHPTSSTGAPTGDALASFLVGAPSHVERPSDNTNNNHGWVNGVYVQDQMQLKPWLTVNIGVRWDYSVWPVAGDGANDPFRYFGNMDLTNGQYVISAQAPPCSSTQGAPCIPGGSLPANVVLSTNPHGSMHATDYGNWQGRIGLAYHPLQKTSILAGYGRVYNEWSYVAQMVMNLNGTWPNVANLQASNLNATVLSDPITDPLHLGTTAIAPAATPFGAAGFYFDPKLKMPYADEWNFGVEQGFGSNNVLTINYVGSIGRKLNINQYTNVAKYAAAGTAAQVAQRQPFPYITPTQYNSDQGSSNYQALQASLHMVSNKGLTYLFSYTWSKAIDVGCSGGFASEACAIQNPYDLRSVRSVAGFDLPQIFSASIIYQLPFGTNRRYKSPYRAINFVLGGWSVNTIVSSTSGTPFTPKVTGNSANTGSKYVFPNVVGNLTPAHRGPQEWFVPSAFQAPAPYTYGNYPRNSLRSDIYKNCDLSVFKAFALYREKNLEFRAEAFDVTNTPTFDIPNIAYGAPTFGVVSGTTNGPRIMQFALKLTF